MKFRIPASTEDFEIDDTWWEFCEMPAWRRPSEHYPPCATLDNVCVLRMDAIDPPRRAADVALLRKEKLVPILLAFRSPECALPPIEVEPIDTIGPERYRVINGCHRYYGSVAVGYPRIPAVIRRRLM
jgi:hypothetical protein